MDSNLAAGLLGAAATLSAVVVGAILASWGERGRLSRERDELAAALLTEINLVVYDTLNSAEVVRRCVEYKVAPFPSAFKRYLPHSPHLYRSLGAKIVRLNARAAGSVVEFYGELEKVIARMDRILVRDRTTTKKARLESLEHVALDWIFVLHAGARAIENLLEAHPRAASQDLLEDLEFRLKAIHIFGKPGDSWTLPDDEIAIRLLTDEEREAREATEARED